MIECFLLTSEIDFRVDVLDKVFVKAAFDIRLREENLSEFFRRHGVESRQKNVLWS